MNLFSTHPVVMRSVEDHHLGHNEAEGGPGHPGKQQPPPLQLDPGQQGQGDQEVDGDRDGVGGHDQLQPSLLLIVLEIIIGEAIVLPDGDRFIMMDVIFIIII